MTTYAAILLEICWKEFLTNNLNNAEKLLDEYKEKREQLKVIPVEIEGLHKNICFLCL